MENVNAKVLRYDPKTAHKNCMPSLVAMIVLTILVTVAAFVSFHYWAYLRINNNLFTAVTLTLLFAAVMLMMGSVFQWQTYIEDAHFSTVTLHPDGSITVNISRGPVTVHLTNITGYRLTKRDILVDAMVDRILQPPCGWTIEDIYRSKAGYAIHRVFNEAPLIAFLDERVKKTAGQDKIFTNRKLFVHFHDPEIPGRHTQVQFLPDNSMVMEQDLGDGSGCTTVVSDIKSYDFTDKSYALGKLKVRGKVSATLWLEDGKTYNTPARQSMTIPRVFEDEEDRQILELLDRCIRVNKA